MEKHNKRRAFTLVELIVVVIIIGILAAMSIPAFMNTQERAFDRDSIASLKLIQAAEKIYKLETGSYYPSSGSVTDHGNINSVLRLSLPTTSSKWNYTVYSTGNTSALRNSGSKIRTWTLPIANEDPTCSGSGTCP